MKQLPGLVTASKRRYQSNIFTRTWWNIVIFHTFFVLVMVIVFAYILYYTKLNLFATINQTLLTALQGGVVDSSIINIVSEDLDSINTFILGSMVVFAALTGVIAAHITLVPTRDEFALRKKFITAVAHELRTPLAVLRTSNEVALFETKNEELKKVLESNIDETKHIANILNNLVIFSRVGAEESMPFEPTDITATLQAVIKKLAQYAEKHSVNIHFEPHTLPLVEANTTSLEQIFYNLIKNAIIYSKNEGGVITISTKSNTTYTAISVSDTGIGMSRKNLKHIFEPFFRINPDSSQAASGTGLGLSLIFEIMKLHKGIISVESAEGVGTTFTLQFPLQTVSIIHEPLLSIPTHKNALSYSFVK